MVKLVKTRLRRWDSGNFLELWNEALDAASDSHHSRKKKKAPQEMLRRSNARRARRAVEDGQYRKAIQALSSGGLAPPTPEVLNEMLAKHPQDPLPVLPTDPCPTPAVISERAVLRALKSFASGSAPGPSSFRVSHFKEAVLCPSPDRATRALHSLTAVVQLLSAGQLPLVVPHLCGATLLACQKKRRNQGVFVPSRWGRSFAA